MLFKMTLIYYNNNNLQQRPTNIINSDITGTTIPTSTKGSDYIDLLPSEP